MPRFGRGLVLACAGLAGVAVAGWSLWLRRPPAAAPEASSSAGRADAREVAELRRELGVLRRQTARVASLQQREPFTLQPETKDEPDERDDQGPDAEPLGFDEMAAASEAKAIARQNKIRKLLDTDNVHSPWSDHTLQEAQSVMADLDAQVFHDTRLVASRCGGDICEFEVAHGNLNESVEFPEAFELRSAGHIFGRREPGREAGSYVSWVYVARTPEALPHYE